MNEKYWLEQVKNNPLNLKKCPKQTPKICLEALKNTRNKSKNRLEILITTKPEIKATTEWKQGLSYQRAIDNIKIFENKFTTFTKIFNPGSKQYLPTFIEIKRKQNVKSKNS